MKKVFKTVLRLLLCGMMAVNLSACDKKNDPKPDEGDKTEATPTDPETSEEPQEPETPQVPECMVDLGLSVYWASMNLGANAPEEYGDYYAWGETTTKDEYTADNCQAYGKSLDELLMSDVIDGSNNLNPFYDAAKSRNSLWRMPTLAEINELKENCQWNWTTLNDVNGYKVTGPNGNSIFLPAAGYYDGSSNLNVGSNGLYWSSTGHDDGSRACYLSFYSGYYAWLNGYYRYQGRSVRPVMDK